jgi:hypothetical protein
MEWASTRSLLRRHGEWPAVWIMNLTDLRNTAGGAGLGVRLDELDATLAAFEPRNVDDARVRAQTLADADEKHIVEFGSARASAMLSANALVATAMAVVVRAEQIVSLKREGAEAGEAALHRAQNEIRTDLDLIDRCLTTLERGHAG